MRRQFAMNVIARGLGSCLQAILLIAFARAVNPHVFGLTNALLGVAAIASVLFDMGVTTYIVRTWAFDRDVSKVARALRISRCSSLCLGGVVTFIFGVSATVGGAPLHLSLLAVWVALEKNIESYLSVHIAQQGVIVPALSIGIRRIVPLALYVAFDVIQLDPLISLIIALCAGGIAGQLHASFTMPREFKLAPGSVSARAVLRDARPLGIAALASQLRNGDVFLVGVFANLTASGGFAAATKLTIPIYLVASALATSVMPAVAKVGSKAVTHITYFLFGALGIGLLGVFVTQAWCNGLMQWIFGPSYAGAGQLLFLILLGTVIGAAAFPITTMLQSAGHSVGVARLEGASAVLLLIAISLGAALAGAEGAAIGALIAQSLRTLSLSFQLLFRMARPSRLSSHGYGEEAIR